MKFRVSGRRIFGLQNLVMLLVKQLTGELGARLEFHAENHARFLDSVAANLVNNQDVTRMS